MKADKNLVISGLKAYFGERVLREKAEDKSLPLNPQHLCHYTDIDIPNEEKYVVNSNTAFMILIQIPVIQASVRLLIDPEITIAQIKEMIFKETQIPPRKQLLIHCNKYLEDTAAVKKYPFIEHMPNIFLSIKKLGGYFTTLHLHRDFFNAQYNRDFTAENDPQNLIRGGKPYTRPIGSKRFGINVFEVYSDDGNEWLQCDGSSGEWPVAYHGTKEGNVKSIIAEGFKESIRCQYGKGIYCTPDPQTALEYAISYTYEDNDYYLIFQTRVNPKTVVIVKEANPDPLGHGEYWLVPDTNDIRPYGVCVYPVSGAFPIPKSSFCSID
uniref:Ubiquitin-like domain-containing protein n=1 Tax=Panagrolaimus sp. PS1159 TaxID=55785 RepID=A0AC35G0X2_9BILA